MGKVFRKLQKKIIGCYDFFNVKKYMKKYTHYLQKCGVHIDEYTSVGYIHPSAYLDPMDYSLFTIGHNVTISKEVMMLVHDFSIWNGMIALDPENEKKRFKFMKPITIGNNCFIGARSFILPGTTIGDNVIIGAASVVKGNIPPNTVWAGNPAKQICTIEEFANKHISKKDYIEI